MRKLLVLLLLCGPLVQARAAVTAWVHDYLKDMNKLAAPPQNQDTVLSCQMTPGEYEPSAFAVYPTSTVRVSVSFIPDSSRAGVPLEWVEVCEVRSLSPTSRPNRLYDITGPLDLPPSQSTFFWITLHPPENAKAGSYFGRVALTFPDGVISLPLECEVLPFRLEKSPITGGVFMETANIPASWYADMKEHGLDAIQYFWIGCGVTVNNQDGQLVVGFAGQDSFVANMMAGGMEGPIIFSLGNDYNLHYEKAIANAFGIRIYGSAYTGSGEKQVWGPDVSPYLDSLFVVGLKQIKEHWDQMNFPEQVVLIYDEPTERLLARCKSRYDLLKTVMPDRRVYGVVMNRRQWALDMLNQCDIIVSDGDYLGCRDVAQANNKDYWVYCFPLAHVYSSRYGMGCMPWRSEAQGTFFWMYNYWTYDPDGCAVYRDSTNLDQPIRSTSWEGIREGMDDLRYFATAEAMIGRAGGQDKAQAEQSLLAIHDMINPDSSQLSTDDLRYVRSELIGIVRGLMAAGVPSYEKTCDFNGDGKASILDLIAYLGLCRSDPDNYRLDWNQDGTRNIFDLLDLLRNLTRRTCP